jgi:hypothetical protein
MIIKASRINLEIFIFIPFKGKPAFTACYNCDLYMIVFNACGDKIIWIVKDLSD